MTTRVVVPYESGVDGIPRPYLGLSLRGPSGEHLDLRGLLDTGADRSVLPLAVVERLGIPRSVMEPIAVESARGISDAWQVVTPIQARLPAADDFSLELRPLAVEGIVEPHWGRDLLESIQIAFSERDKLFSIFVG